MPLRTGTSVWQLSHRNLPAAPRLERDAECDVAIVGAGISGAMIAVHLARAGMKVIVLDHDQPLHGSTLACTALLQYELDVPLIELRKLIGAANADLAYLECHAALLRFPAFAASIDARDTLVHRPSLYIAGDALAGENLRAEAGERHSLGIDATYLEESALLERFGLRRQGGAILSKPAFAVDPVALSAACLRDAAVHGTQICSGASVRSQETSGDSVTLRTSAGPTVRARHVVYATGYEADHLLGFQVGHRTTTYALATAPLNREPWPQSAMIWEASRPYLYARTTPHGRICIGGADEPIPCGADSEEQIQRKAAELLEKFAAIRPDLPLKVATTWSGTFVTTRDGLPYIGAVPAFPAATFALGYSGNGILFSYLAAQLVTARLLGREHALAELVAFSPARQDASVDILRPC